MYGCKKEPPIVASDFLNWFYVVLIGLLVCVVKGKAKPTAAAIERGFGKYGRSIAGDVESPSLLPLLLLLLLAAAAAVLLLLLLLRLLLDTAAASSCCSCCCGGGGGSRFHMMEKPPRPRRRP